MSSRVHRVLPLSAMACLAWTQPVIAQRVSLASASSPVVIQSMHSMTIPPIVGVVESALVPASGGAAACSGTCFDATVTVRANTRWQLQVAVHPSLDQTSIEWIEPGASVVHRLTPRTYLTVASGNEPTLQHAVALRFTARDEAGGAAPLDSGQLAALLSYRVVPLP